MKFNILWLLMTTIFFTGCNKMIDIEPENSLTFKNGVKSEKDIESLIAGAGKLLLDLRFNYPHQAIKGSYADSLRKIGGQSVYPSRELSPQTEINRDGWSYHYLVIAQSNEILHFVNILTLTEERKNLYEGQALFYKAYVYFELIRRFGDCVLIRDEVNINPQAKTPWAEVADYAIETATRAAELLPELDKVRNNAGVKATSRSTPCKGAANALLAHLCAWKAGGKYFAFDAGYDDQELWRKAEEACSHVISSINYQLAADPEAVCVNVLSGQSMESIFENVYQGYWNEMSETERGSSPLLAGYYQDWPVMPNSSPYNIVNKYIYFTNEGMLKMFPGTDLRKYAYFYQFEEMSKPENFPISQGFAYPYKFRKIYVETEGWQAGSFVNYDVNHIVWRLADVILLRAECRARLGNTAGAITDINTVRARAQASLYDQTEYDGDIRYAVFKERERELLIEGHRFYDIIRNGYARTELSGGFKTATDQDFKDGAFFRSLDDQEMRRNPLMRQNKYWAKFL